MFFMCQSMEILNVFNILTLKQVFWKAKILFKKLDYHLLAGSAKTERETFPWKTALSEANVKTNRMATTKWSYNKQWRFSVTNLFFQKFCFSLRTLYKEFILSWILIYQSSKYPYPYFSKLLEFQLRVFLPY